MTENVPNYRKDYQLSRVEMPFQLALYYASQLPVLKEYDYYLLHSGNLIRTNNNSILSIPFEFEYVGNVGVQLHQLLDGDWLLTPHHKPLNPHHHPSLATEWYPGEIFPTLIACGVRWEVRPIRQTRSLSSRYLSEDDQLQLLIEDVIQFSLNTLDPDLSFRLDPEHACEDMKKYLSQHFPFFRQTDEEKKVYKRSVRTRYRPMYVSADNLGNLHMANIHKQKYLVGTTVKPRINEDYQYNMCLDGGLFPAKFPSEPSSLCYIPIRATKDHLLCWMGRGGTWRYFICPVQFPPLYRRKMRKDDIEIEFGSQQELMETDIEIEF